MAIVNKSMDKDGNPVEVGYSFNNSECDSTIVGARSTVTWLTVTVNTSSKKFVITGQPNESGERAGEIIPTINGSDCSNRIRVTQGDGARPKITCVRGTDNGNDVINDKIYLNPLFICSDQIDDGDSIVVSSITYYNGSTMVDLPTNAADAVRPIDNSTGAECTWVKMYRSTADPGICNYGMMAYIFTANTSSSEREVTFRLGTTAEETAVVTYAGHPQYGQQYSIDGLTNTCPEWDVTIKQCGSGYYWCFTNDSETAATMVRCGEACTAGGRAHCTSSCGGGACSCGSIAIDNIVFDHDEVEEEAVNISAPAGCVTSSSANDTEHFWITANTTNIIVDPKEENTGSDPYVDTVTVILVLSDGSSCTKTFTATQYGTGGTHDCGCSVVKSGLPTEIDFTAEASSKTFIIFDGSLPTTCKYDFGWGTNGYITWMDSILDRNTGILTVTVEALPDDVESRGDDGEAYIDIVYPLVGESNTCHTFTVVQSRTNCKCSSIIIPANPVFDYDEIDEQTINYIAPTGCITRVTADDTTHFWLTANTSSITIEPKEENTGSEAYIDTVTVTFTLSSGGACTKTFTATQNGTGVTPTCVCREISDITDIVFDYDETEEQTINVTAPSGCIARASANDTEHFWITANTANIIVDPKEENTGSDPYVDTVTVTFTLSSGGACTKTFTATQNGTGETHVCSCGNVTGVLNIKAAAIGGVFLGSFTGDSQCLPSDFKVVKYGDEQIVNVSDTVIYKDNTVPTLFKVYANITKQNTSENGRVQRLLIQKVNGGQMCGSPMLIEQQGTTPKCIVELVITKSSTNNCGINFKVKEKCSDIGTYDVIEWGYTTANTPSFDGQAFGAESATGATGITQDANIPETVPTNYHIWWRNRTVQSVSGMSTVQLSKCEHTPTKFSATVRIDQVEDSSMSPNSIDWGDGYVTTPLEKGAEYIHMYNDDTQDYTCTVFGNRVYTMNKNNHHVTVCDCVALPEIDPYVFFGNTSSSKSINVNPNGCSNMYWVKEGSQTWCTPQFEEDDTKLKLTASSNSSGNIRSAVFLVGIRAGSSSQDPRICQWIYAKQGATATCNTVYTEMNGKTVYFEFNDSTQTILTNCKYANMKDIKTGSTSDIEYEEYDGDKWSWEEYERYGKNWITGCTWLTTGGLQINVTGNYSNTTRSATLNIRLLDDADNTICARIYVSQYCEHCTSAGSRDAGSNDEG